MGYKKNKVSIHQPDFIPYIGFFNKIYKSDTYVVMDNVQISKSGWTHRDLIKTKSGVEWITIPVKNIKKKQLIKDVIINNEQDWKKKHLNIIYENYKDTKYFDESFELIKELYHVNFVSLFEFNFNIIQKLFKIFELNPKIIFLSTLEVKGNKNELLIEILKKLKSNIYVSGQGAKNFIDVNMFNDKQISVEFNNFIHPEYKQINGDFISNLSIIDIILNCGINQTKILIKNV